jgi:hypothetical protein
MPLVILACLALIALTTLVHDEVLRLLAGAEALNGLVLIGWSASFTYIAMERFWSPGDPDQKV